MFGPHLPSTYGLTGKVRIVPKFDDPASWTISWVSVPDAVKYYVYVSPGPLRQPNLSKFKSVFRTVTSVDFRVPQLVPDDIIFYAWVSYENAYAQEVFLQDEPVYTAINTAFDVNPLSVGTERDIFSDPDVKWRIESIRRRNLAMLENDGEDFYLYIRRPFGMPCVCMEENSTSPTGKARVTPMYTDDMQNLDSTFNPETTGEEEANDAKDSGYQSTYMCEECLGTGIAGGYFPKMLIKIRYGNLPIRGMEFQEQGIKYTHEFNSWTLWHPRLKDRDVLVRIRTNERYKANNVGQTEWRGMPMHQQFNAAVLPRTDIAYKISDENIQKALEIEGGWDVAKFDWSCWS